MKKIIFIAFTLLFGELFSQPNKEISLHQNWSFRNKGDSKWLPASVPGTVHTDLIANNIIPDPFVSDNEKKVAWVENEDWLYQKTFQISKKDLANNHIELVCEGLDTYAKVYVNGSLVITADNMFRNWNTEIKKLLKEGNNKIFIEFSSAVKKGKELAKELSYTLPGDEKVFTRKAQYQYGWDWGPRLVTCGIWKNIKLNFWSDVKIRNVYYNQKILNDSIAEIEFTTEIESANNSTINLSVAENSNIKKENIVLHKGKNNIKSIYTIKNPKRWWCNGLGNPNLYLFHLKIESILYSSSSVEYHIDGLLNSGPIDKKELQIGLRTIELLQEKDSIGKSFYFKLNGIPVFMKGANFIPPDNFLSRVTKEKYQEIIQSAIDANMNMLRVWGGGTYADDEFYNECDKKGILVWQDFMFACAMYPGNNSFLENIKQEISEQTQRLRNHPSIALWCGNNEIDEGWVNWGWQKQHNYSEADSSNIWNDYTNLFQKQIPTILDSLGIDRNLYWQSSPSIGWGHKESLRQGDSHYWGVWWGMEPFENYTIKVGRFMSEYGFQGMPSKNVLKNIFENDAWTLNSEKLKVHQKHPKGFETIEEYMQRDYRKPKDFTNYVYVSKLLQAEGMKTAIEAHRRAKSPDGSGCMGTLYWQLNDCWNSVSWSSIDYSGTWKALHYQAKKSYEQILISANEENEKLNIYIINDELKTINAKLSLKLLNFKGEVLWSNSSDISIESNSSKIYFSIDKKEFEKISKNEILMSMEVVIPKALLLSSNIYYFSKPKDLKLSKPNIKCTIIDKNKFEIETDILAKDVYISIGGKDVNLSDNYFDLLPNSKKMISTNTGNKKDLRNSKIEIKTLADSYNEK